MKLKLTTYNIQYGVGQDEHYDIQRTIDALEGQDIICLQEVSSNWATCNMDHQPDRLAEGLNRYMAFAPSYEVDGSYQDASGVVKNVRRSLGNMILSRWPILYSRAHSLPRPFVDISGDFHPRVDFPRVALEAIVNVEGHLLRFVSIHLSQLPGIQRRAQIEKLKYLIDNLPLEASLWELDKSIYPWSEDKDAPPVPTSTLLLGDFNFEPSSDDYSLILEKSTKPSMGLSDAWEASNVRGDSVATCVENDNRLSRVDYMFVTQDLQDKIVSAEVDQSTVASDHFPVKFLLEL